MTETGKLDLIELCQAASQEDDPQKLMQLLEQINTALAQQEKSRQPLQSDSNSP
jgi:hypothetical protein